MYLSHSTTTLVLLIMLFGVISFTMLDTYKNSALEEASANTLGLKADSLEIMVSNSIPKVFNKVLNDAEFQVINSHNSGSDSPFFDNTDSVLNYLDSRTETEVHNNLESVKTAYEDSGYDLDYNFEVTNISMVNGFTFNLEYTLDYNLSKSGALRSKSYEDSKNVTVKTIISAYHYVMSDKKDSLYIKNPNTQDLENFPVFIVLNNSNYNFDKNNNGEGLDFYHNGVKLNYWVEYWNSSSLRPKAFVWLKMNLSANSVQQVDIHYEGTGISDGKNVFTMFDDFESSDDTIFKKYIFEDNDEWDYDTSTSPFSNPLYNNNMTYSLADYQPPRMITYDTLNSVTTDNIYHPTQGRPYIAEVDLKGKEDGYSSPQMLMGFYGDYNGAYELGYYTAELGGSRDYIYYFTTNNFYGDIPLNEDYLIIEEYYEQYYYSYLADSYILHNDKDWIGVDSGYSPSSDTWYRLKVVLDHVMGDTRVQVATLDDYIYYNNKIYHNYWRYGTYRPRDSYFILGSSNGDNLNNPELYYDNFRVRKYAQFDPYVSGSTLGNNLIYISPPTSSDKYEIGGSNAVFVENPTSPSIVDMLTGLNNSNWGYGITVSSYL
ncbi:hypothetical protein J3E07_000160 [Methanococcus voltae]|uniref:DUF2341 domain-containing protein n=1 Tax=Methanococcus voltae TaxID=2188 RepID=A0A8J7RCL1_METVO|nr:DUF2341 domain-containing protein [Methanococcus voltae]MBP2200762.1 hypothetical protein [Methanococcus voltae]